MSTGSSHRAADVQPDRDPLGMINGEGVITGTVVSAAVIAASAGHLQEGHIVFAILGTAFIYWLAHLHARTLGDAVKHRTHPVDAFERRSQKPGRSWQLPCSRQRSCYSLS